jgi:hypothetical protein
MVFDEIAAVEKRAAILEVLMQFKKIVRTIAKKN